MTSPILETRHLRLVVALADEGGPTRAAAKLHLTQSAVSHQLSELESKLGVLLFARVRRKLELTAAGRKLVQYARAALGELAAIERELRRSRDGARRALRVSTECFTCYHWLPSVLTELQRDHADVDVRVVLEATKRPLVALLEGELDLAIVSSPVREPSLVQQRLFADEWVVIAAPSDPLAGRAYVRAKELETRTLFTHDGTARDVARLRERLAAERARMPRVQVVPMTDAIVELVKAGLGVGLLSRWAVAPYERSAQIVARRFTRAGLVERWTAVHRDDPQLRAPLVRLVQLLRASRAG